MAEQRHKCRRYCERHLTLPVQYNMTGATHGKKRRTKSTHTADYAMIPMRRFWDLIYHYRAT